MQIRRWCPTLVGTCLLCPPRSALVCVREPRYETERQKDMTPKKQCGELYDSHNGSSCVNYVRPSLPQNPAGFRASTFAGGCEQRTEYAVLSRSTKLFEMIYQLRPLHWGSFGTGTFNGLVHYPCPLSAPPAAAAAAATETSHRADQTVLTGAAGCRCALP